MFCYLLWAYILCIVASLINFRFRNFMNFYTDKLNIASLFNFDCNCHVIYTYIYIYKPKVQWK